MDLENLIDPEYGLRQDDFSQSRPRYGDGDHLEIIGWSGRNRSNKLYIVRCGKCAKDPELFGEGFFRSSKGNMEAGQIPCGCSKSPNWSREQLFIRCTRKAQELGHEFLGFDGDWMAIRTKVTMYCKRHGEWSSSNIDNLLNGDRGCPGCKVETLSKLYKKPDEIMVENFLSTGAFHPETKFWRSERLNSFGRKSHWFMSCPECEQIGEATHSDLNRGQRPCGCSKQRQQECYINWVKDGETPVVIKFGMATNSLRRVRQQNSKSVYKISAYLVYTFPDVSSCKKAERECKQELECAILPKEEIPDGWTETTWIYNLDKIIEIYERNGGVKK